jgi:F0F1-type ATP synthase membrane subunit c/vacuolar-type H+-ATPase subunit K
MVELAIGVAAIGIGSVGVGLGIFFGKYLEGIARNPGTVTEMNRFIFIGFALIETIAIYILVLAFLLYGKI